MIALRQVSLQRGTQALLEGADLTLHAGHKAGIVGANGAGKSSLFKLLLGELTPDRGEVEMSGGQRIAHMAQEVEALSRSLLDHVLDGHTELRRAEAALAEAREAVDVHREAELHGVIEALDGYSAPARAAQLLVGLGFAQQDLERPLSSFSGGWRMRVNLARTLFMPSDLLLLDEPTNHLDLDALLWLEQWLTRYPGTLLLISHDRDFLDAVCDSIVHFDRRSLVLYRGNYTTFERTRAEKLALQQAEAAKQQARREEIERFVARFRAKATKARAAQSRLKMLERMGDIAVAHADSPFHFSLPAADKTSHPLLVLDEARLGYRPGGETPDTERVQLDNVRLTLLPGQRIGLLGPNGAGKSTLIKALTGELPLLAGKRIAGEHLKVGYFAQHQLEGLDLVSTPFMHVQRLSPTASDQEIRNFLGGFGFPGDDVFGEVGRFSGGEKARLALALVAWQKPNLLLLDEPTNHLDLEMREALTEALAGFEGTVIIVSHDRHLLRASVDEFWRVADHRVEPFDGDLEDYRLWLKARLEGERREARGDRQERQLEGGVPREDRKASRRAAAELREKLRPLKKQRDRAEQAMEKVQAELAGVEEVLGDAELYTDPARKEELTATLARQGELKSRLEDLEAEWLAAEEALETMEAELGG
ncbi:ATP-binding cassette domain-containing protein [Halomonas icarae]|uniref:Probable ATP-binding protein YheS n=1 Tax=Halomonas icarae TaxID=2691040 RepID=A0A7X4W028_9GAMM|nr:ATP-binding cassette domain-containing protein [Halomonas icarae]MDR5902511.1 ATP-binding cassette domain-containing protein [Halomonas icarae]NAW13405.1 ATP-binding cassette domain-containing protein [Halomonas icarae]